MRISSIKGFTASQNFNKPPEEGHHEHNFTAREVQGAFQKTSKPESLKNSGISRDSQTKPANLKALSLLQDNYSDSGESQVRAVDINSAFHENNKNVKGSGIDTTNDSNQKMRSSGMGERFKNRVQSKAYKEDQESKESNSSKSSQSEKSHNSESSGNSTERELEEQENSDEEGDNPYANVAVKSNIELKTHDISEIKRQGSQWDNHIENLDDSRGSRIFEETIEKSSMDSFQGFDNSVATHEEMQKADNFFFNSQHKNTLNKKSFEDIFGINQESSRSQRESQTPFTHKDSMEDLKESEEANFKVEKPDLQISNFENAGNGAEGGRFKKRKKSTVVVSSRNDTPKIEKTVTFDQVFRSKNENKDSKLSINHEEEENQEKSKHVGADRRRKRGAGVKIKISKPQPENMDSTPDKYETDETDETDEKEENEPESENIQIETISKGADLNESVDEGVQVELEQQTKPVVSEDVSSPFKDEPRKLNQFTKKLIKQESQEENAPRMDTPCFSNIQSYNTSVKGEISQTKETILEEGEKQSKNESIDNDEGAPTFEDDVGEVGNQSEGQTKNLPENGENNSNPQQFDTPKELNNNIEEPQLENESENVNSNPDPFEAASAQFAQSVDTQSQQIHTPSSGAVFKMDDFESVFSQSKNLNPLEAKNQILPHPSSKNVTTEEEDFFSTSSQPQNPLLSPAPEIFEQETAPDEKKAEISKVDEVDIKQEESQSQIHNSISQSLAIENGDGSPFKIDNMISPIPGKVIEFDQNRIDTPDESTEIKAGLGEEESNENETFDPFNQGFGAFGEESESQIVENPQDMFKKDDEPVQSVSNRKNESELIEEEVLKITKEANDEEQKEFKEKIKTKEKFQDGDEAKETETEKTQKKKTPKVPKIPIPSIQNLGFDMSEPTPIYKGPSKPEIFGFDNPSESHQQDSQLGGVSWGEEDKSVVLEELPGESLDNSTNDKFFDGI